MTPQQDKTPARAASSIRSRWALQRTVTLGAFAALLALGSLSLVPSLALGDEPPAAAAPASGMSPDEVEREAEAIARSIMSPFCPGRTVSACPNAGPWREDIRKWVGEGVDPLEIKKRLADRVPEHNLGGVPKNRLGWVLPVGLGIGAIAILVFLLRYLIGPRGGSASPAGKAEPGGAAPEKLASEGVAPRGKADAVPPNANGEDWDARLEEELDTLER